MCSDMEDSRRPSDFVIEAQKTISYIFKGAEYKECFEKNMESLAHFIIPIQITKAPNESLDTVYMVSNADYILVLGVPPFSKRKIR